MGLRPGKAKGPWVGVSGGAPGSFAPVDAQYVVMTLDPTLTQERVLTAGNGISVVDGGANGPVTVAARVTSSNFTSRQITSDGAIELGAFHDYMMDITIPVSVILSTKPIITSGDWQFNIAVGLTCIAATNPTNAFREHVPDNFDYWVRFTLGAATQTGLQVSGGGNTASLTWDNTPQLVAAFTGQPNVNVPFAGGTVFLRLARDSDTISFYYRTAGSDPWTLIVSYNPHGLGEDQTASLVSGIGAVANELVFSEGIPEIRAANVGAGTGTLYRDKGVQNTLNIKSIAAGSGIGVANNANDVTISNSAPESTSVANVGTGTGQVFRNMTGTQINLKTIKQGTNITVVNNADDITINASGGGLTVWQDHIRATEQDMFILANGSFGRSSTSGAPSADDNWWTRIDTLTAQGNCKIHFHKALHPWYNGGNITARLHFLMSFSPGTGNASFELFAQGLVDGNSTAFNPASVGTVTKNFSATPRYFYADIGPFTPAGAAAGCFLFCRLHRTDANTNVYPRLMEVTLTYTVTAP